MRIISFILLFSISIIIISCNNNHNISRIYFNIDPNVQEIFIPVHLNDSIKANMVFDTGAGVEGKFSLDSLFITKHSSLIPKIYPDTSHRGSAWVNERYLNLLYKNINQKVKIGNTDVTFKDLQIINWKKAINDDMDGLFSIPKSDTTHLWELNFEHNYLEIHPITAFKMPKDCLQCPIIFNSYPYSIKIPIQMTFSNGDTLTTNHIYIIDSAMGSDIALICPNELAFFKKHDDDVWTYFYDGYSFYTVNAMIFNNLSIDSLRIYIYNKTTFPTGTCLIGLNFLKRFNIFFDLKNRQIGLQPIKNFQRIVNPVSRRFHYSTEINSKGQYIITFIADYKKNYYKTAGLQTGDEITAINGISIKNITFETVKQDTLLYDIIRQGKPMKIVVPVDKNEKQGD